jgi:hypothetical protein
LPHPPDSPDLAPSDFFLFGYLKAKLLDFQPDTRDALKTAITEAVNGIGKEILLSVFETGIKRAKWVIKHSGEYC